MSNRQIGQIAIRNMADDLPFHNHKIQLAPESGALDAQVGSGESNLQQAATTQYW
jgi:hypothetical protein